MCATWLRVAENDKLLFGDELGILHTFTFNDEWGGYVHNVHSSFK